MTPPLCPVMLGERREGEVVESMSDWADLEYHTCALPPFNEHRELLRVDGRSWLEPPKSRKAVVSRETRPAPLAPPTGGSAEPRKELTQLNFSALMGEQWLAPVRT